MARTKSQPTTALIPLEPSTQQALPVHQREEPAAPVLPAPILRAQKMGLMMGQLITRSLSNQAASATVLPTRLDADTLREVALIQQAVFKRVQQQQKDWLEGCQGIAQEYSQLKLANTMSKFVEQEYNIVAQMGALVSSQTASWVGLMENIQVDYAYWISQKQPAVSQ